VALIDEATGYQEIRDRKALEAILDAYLRKEFAAWAKRFPDEFYQQIFRLRGWIWKGMKVNRPQVVGHYTNDLVWDRIAPGLRKELEERNPKNERGQRRFRHPQWLTEDIGDPALAQHLYALMGLQRACPDRGWKQFYEMVQRAFPKKGETVPFTFTEGEPVA
jgi:P63C domain